MLYILLHCILCSAVHTSCWPSSTPPLHTLPSHCLYIAHGVLLYCACGHASVFSTASLTSVHAFASLPSYLIGYTHTCNTTLLPVDAQRYISPWFTYGPRTERNTALLRMRFCALVFDFLQTTTTVLPILIPCRLPSISSYADILAFITHDKRTDLISRRRARAWHDAHVTVFSAALRASALVLPGTIGIISHSDTAYLRLPS